MIFEWRVLSFREETRQQLGFYWGLTRLNKAVIQMPHSMHLPHPSASGPDPASLYHVPEPRGVGPLPSSRLPKSWCEAPGTAYTRL